jgi:seryl-tRNA synthetase
MTLQEILKSQGLTDEQIATIASEMKQNKIFTAGEENLDIRYSKLKADHDNLVAQHGESTKLIDQLKAGTKDSEALQGKITSYEAQIAQLNEQLKQTQMDAAIQVALLGAKATDVDYMTFRLREKGDLELDEQGHIKNIDDKLAGLKTQFPAFFESAADQRELQPHKLAEHKLEESGMTKSEFLRKPYAERVAFANEHPEAYNNIMNH